MKKLALILAASFFFQLNIFSQPYLPQGITFWTQSDIDSFQSNYPYCAEIEGDVTIGVYGSSDITNLVGLNVVTAIGGELRNKNNENDKTMNSAGQIA